MALEVKVRDLARSDAAVALVGDLDDAGGKSARRQLARIVQSGKLNLTIDLDRVDVLESAGLAALIATLRLARDRGGSIHVQTSKPAFRRIMELTGLSRIFRVTPTAEPTAA
jgi:anti-anti-sigma factor